LSATPKPKPKTVKKPIAPKPENLDMFEAQEPVKAKEKAPEGISKEIAEVSSKLPEERLRRNEISIGDYLDSKGIDLDEYQVNSDSSKALGSMFHILR
jgi:hypothetical protein